MYNDLSEEAKIIFLNYLINYDDYLYNFHKNNVVESNSNVIKLEPIQDNLIPTPNKYTTSSTSNILNLLNYNLSQIQGLSESVIYALMAAGASFVADIASLGATKIVSILLGAGCLIVLVKHWGRSIT